MENCSEKDYIYNIYQQMKNNSDLAGTYRLVEDRIEWELFDGFLVQIGSEYIGIDRLKKIPDSLMHWHPEEDRMFDDICALGTKGNVTVIRKLWFGLATFIVYMGPKKDCPYTKKRGFGKYYYLYA